MRTANKTNYANLSKSSNPIRFDVVLPLAVLFVAVLLKISL